MSDVNSVIVSLSGVKLSGGVSALTRRVLTVIEYLPISESEDWSILFQDNVAKLLLYSYNFIQFYTILGEAVSYSTDTDSYPPHA